MTQRAGQRIGETKQKGMNGMQRLIHKMVPEFNGSCEDMDDWVQIVDIAYTALGTKSPGEFMKEVAKKLVVPDLPVQMTKATRWPALKDLIVDRYITRGGYTSAVRGALGKLGGRPLTGPTEKRSVEKIIESCEDGIGFAETVSQLARMVKLRLEGEQAGSITRRIKTRGFANLLEIVAYATGRKLEHHQESRDNENGQYIWSFNPHECQRAGHLRCARTPHNQACVYCAGQRNEERACFICAVTVRVMADRTNEDGTEELEQDLKNLQIRK